jgi:hypothetical protein
MVPRSGFSGRGNMPTGKKRPGKKRRTFRAAAWTGRVLGWALIFLAIFSIPQVGGLAPFLSRFRLLPSLALGLVGIVWVIGIELFFGFFNRYLSGN